MRILVADDDPVSRKILDVALKKWGHDLVVVDNGRDALDALLGDDPPPLAILDWMMPQVTGVEICRQLEQSGRPGPRYVLILSSRQEQDDVVAGLEAGADDYLVKPVRLAELRARLDGGCRLIELEMALRDRVRELEEAQGHILELQRILPMCSFCRSIRDDEGFWQSVETYFRDHADLRFTHGLCPKCLEEHYPDIARKIAAMDDDPAASTET